VALMKRPEQKAKEAIRDSNQYSTRKSKEESVANNTSKSNRKN
jgi:hypothetical protein